MYSLFDVFRFVWGGVGKTFRWRTQMERFPECGKPIDLDLGANLEINAALVPSNLQILIPLVNKWAFVNLHDQDVFVTRMKRSRPDEIESLNNVFDSDSRQQIREWSATLPFDKHVNEFTEEDWQHPYWQFLHVLKLRETTGGHEDDPAVQAAIERCQAERRAARYADATTAADNLFRENDFAGFVRLLTPFADLLTETQAKKISIAKKRCKP